MNAYLLKFQHKNASTGENVQETPRCRWNIPKVVGFFLIVTAKALLSFYYLYQIKGATISNLSVQNLNIYTFSI